jgi:hypothetical protein
MQSKTLSIPVMADASSPSEGVAVEVCAPLTPPFSARVAVLFLE